MRNKQKKNYTNSELVAAILDAEQRDQAIYFAWHDRKMQRMGLATIRSILKDKNLVWDTYDRSIMAFVRNIEDAKFEGRSNWRTYLVSICRFKALKALEMVQKYEMKKEAFKQEQNTSEQIASPEEALIELESESEIESILQSVLGQVSENCRAVLKAFYFEGFKANEIASQKKITEQSVKNALFRCRIKLRELILQDPQAMQILEERVQSWKKKKK